MSEDDARAWIATTFGQQAAEQLARFAALVIEETNHQNLIAPSTASSIWTRHLLDSAQLLRFLPSHATSWVDIGSGAGFPGVVVSILYDGAVTLVEPRARRAEFLTAACHTLGIAEKTTVIQRKAEAVGGTFDVVSARAVASIPALLDMTRHLRRPKTRMILPRGRSGEEELEVVRRGWHGMFHVEQSLSDIGSTIIIADGVTR